MKYKSDTEEELTEMFSVCPIHFLTRAEYVDFKYENEISSYLSPNLPGWAIPTLEKETPDHITVRVRVFGPLWLEHYFRDNCSERLQSAGLMWKMGGVGRMQWGHVFDLHRLTLEDLVYGCME